MKQSTFKAKLNQYYGDVDQYIDTVIQSNVGLAVLEKPFSERMSSLGVERLEDYTDIMIDIIENEDRARKEGKEPVRRVYYYTEYEEPEEGVAPVNYKNQAVKKEVWIDYTEDDYLYLVKFREEMARIMAIPTRQALNTSYAIAQQYKDEADLITAECLTILHTATKSDCKDFFDRTRKYIKGLGLDEETEKHVLKYQTREDKDELLDINFFYPLQEPFTMAIQGIRQVEHNKLNDRDPKDFIDFVFKDIRRIHDETRAIVRAWYGKPTKERQETNAYLPVHTKLARTKEINALQTLNLARDSKGVRHTSTASGGLASINVFENKNVEILTTRIEDVSLSTNTRQLLDYFYFKGIEQIPHKGSIERIYRDRAVTVDLDELATVFSIDKKEARKRLNSFYEEVRDLKIKLHYFEKEGRKTRQRIATVNIFDADLQEIDEEERNATARPEDLDDGTQISFYNTGTLFNYNPKRKGAPKNAVQRGRLTMQFSMDFARHLSQASVVRHNPKGYLIDRRKYKSAYSIQCTLENHASMNRGKTNEGIISLDALLKDAYEIPTYDYVMNGNRNTTDRIKKPLLATVQALKTANVLQAFYYCTPDKKKVSEKALLSLPYEDFINCTLIFNLAPLED